VVAVAERALGVAAMTLNDVDEAIRHLRAAVAAAERSRHRSVTGEARMSLASALALRGRTNHASTQIETAVSELSGVARARAHVQHAAILQELGRDAAAFDELRRALPVLRRAGDAEWEIRALSNRSLMHVARRAFAAAERDLMAAKALCHTHGLELPACYAEHNLGYLKAHLGDIPASLRHYDAASERYSAFGMAEPALFMDRAGVLLSVRLLDEARASAREAIAAYRKAGRDMHLPEAQLMLSTVALLQGDQAVAAASAEDAVRGYRRLGERHSLPLARYALLQARYEVDAAAVTAAQLAAVSRDLSRAGWMVPALESLVLAGSMELAGGRPSAARRYLRQAGRARAVGPADARARAWLAEALLRRADGRRSAARSALRAGLRIVEQHQATLGATELRAHVSNHRGALARTGLRMALEDDDPKQTLWWAERGRAVALLQRAARPSGDPQLAQDLSDLRSTMAEQEEARAAGASDEGLIRRQVLLERRIRDRCRTLSGSGDQATSSRESVAGLTTALGGDRALVELIELDDTLYAVTVAAGRAGLHTLGPVADAVDLIRRVEFAVHRLASARFGRANRTRPAAMGLAQAAEALDRLLLQPLADVIGDRHLVVVPSAALQSLPWSVLPSCVGRPVSVSPSAAMWRRATRGRPFAARPPAAVVVAGPGLPGAEAEASAVSSLYDRATVLRGSQATGANLTAAIGDNTVLHLACHGRLRKDNPLFSALLLADGPVNVYELESLTTAPHHVVLAGCDTGRLQVVAGEETLGLGAALLAGGTRTLVASVVPIPDLATVPLMRSYHQALLDGLEPAAALARTQARVDTGDSACRAAAAGFICLGAG
jgi:tetratricopeptide (TPR) repeat protein